MKQSVRPVFVYPSVVPVALYYSVVGYLIPAIRGRFSLSLAEAGLFSTMQSIGFYIAVLLGFVVFGALNKLRVMAVALLLFAVSLAGMAVAPSMAVLCALFLLTGLFANALDSLSNAVISDFAAEERGKYIGLLQAIFSAMGAGASYFALLLHGDYVTVFLGLALLTLASILPFVLGLRGQMRQPWLPSRQGSQKRSLWVWGSLKRIGRLLRVRGVPPVMLLGFLGMFVQISLCYFLSSYVGGFPNSGGADAFALCMLYSGALVGRLVFVRLSHRIDPCRIMAVYNAVALVGVAALLLTKNLTAVCLLALLPGFGLSATFPGLMVKACGLMPEDSATASALIFLGVNTAASAAPPLVGLAGDTLGLQAAFALCAVLLVPVIMLSVRMGSGNAPDCPQTAKQL